MKTLTVVILTSLAGDGLAVGAHASALAPVPIKQVSLQDDFWSPKIKVWRDVTIPDCLAKFEKHGAIANFDKIRDGKGGEHGGPPWYDGLIYEMIRGCADFLAAQRDPKLEARLDGYIQRIAAAAAKDPDGYLNTYTQLKQPTQRWGLNGGDDNWQHDVYNAGAMVEAAAHYYRATGKTALLKTATRLANHMCDVMGPPPKKNVIPGHALGEEALVRLYLLFREHPELKAQMPVPVKETRFLKLAEFWIENRGNHKGRKSLGRYGQDHMPVLQQPTIEGHAVRATLMCAGLSALAGVNGRKDYSQTAVRLWENMVFKRTHITGSVGAFADGERFGPDYLLPNNAYLETCAAVGAAFFHHNMNLLLGNARYADGLERALYNGILSGVSLKGDSYFYTNPLEAGKNRERWSWHTCPCCPPMFIKVMAGLPGCIYATNAQSLYVNLFVGSRVSTTINGVRIALQQTTKYPWEGTVRLGLDPDKPAEFDLNLRLPGWCERATVKINARPVADLNITKGYARLRRQWKRGDVVELDLPMPIRRMKAHPRVAAALGRVALMRGPLAYCIEGHDCEGSVNALVLPPDAPLAVAHRTDLFGGVTVIKGQAKSLQRLDWKNDLYRPASQAVNAQDISFEAIPYFANANRAPAEMRVWLAEDPSRANPAPRPTIASRARGSASHCNADDSVSALNDQLEPAHSADESIPRFTWWDHRGTTEWVQYEFAQPVRVSAVEVYWWDERSINRHCRVPKSWRLLGRDGDDWKPVTGASAYGTQINQSNRVTFDPVDTTALRIEVQLQSGWSGGLLEWTVE